MSDSLGEVGFSSIVAEQSASLYRFVALRLPGEAEAARDIVQECFLALFREGSGFRGQSSVGTWLRAVAKRKVVDHYRRRAREESLSQFEGSHSESLQVYAPDSGLLESDERSRVERCLSALSPERRYSLILKYVDELSQVELARILGKSVKAAESVLARAKSEFARLYEREEGR